MYAPVLVAPEQQAYIATVVGIQVDAESKAYGLLSGFKEQARKTESFNRTSSREKNKSKTGQEIAVIGQAADGSLANDLYIIQDIIKCPVDMINQSGIVMSLDDAQELFVMPNEAHEIVIRDKTSGQSEAVAERLKQLPILKNTEINTMAKNCSTISIDSQILGLYWILRIIHYFLCGYSWHRKYIDDVNVRAFSRIRNVTCTRKQSLQACANDYFRSGINRISRSSNRN